MGKKRTLNRMDYRGDFDEEGGEAKPAAEDEEKDEDEEEEEEEETEAESEAEPDADADADDDGGDDDDAPRPAKKKKKAVAATKVKRTRAPKLVRRKAVWRIFDNSSKLLETFEFNQRTEADAFLEQKNIDKKGTCYIQLVKIELDEKDKDKESEKAKKK